jgi:hypothetical protein
MQEIIDIVILVTIDRILIGNWIYWTLVDPLLQAITGFTN